MIKEAPSEEKETSWKVPLLILRHTDFDASIEGSPLLQAHLLRSRARTIDVHLLDLESSESRSRTHARLSYYLFPVPRSETWRGGKPRRISSLVFRLYGLGFLGKL